MSQEASMIQDAILTFWFGKSRDEYNNGLWWHKTAHTPEGVLIENVDEYIRNKWGYLLDEFSHGWFCVTGNHFAKKWMQTTDGTMALILLLDQFSRHIYRGSPKAFDFDKYAIALAKELLKTAPDMPIGYKKFCYVAFMHSEDPEIVATVSLELYKLANQNNLVDKWRSGLIKTAKVADEHVNILKKFGRYPHRNTILGRVPTIEEIDFMGSKKLPHWMKSVSSSGPQKKQEVIVEEKAPEHVKNKLKILVLHSNRQTAQSFKEKTERYLGRKLAHIADLTYPNAPKPYEPSGESKYIIKRNEYSNVPNAGQGLVWWNASDDPKTMLYNGLDDSLIYIDSLFKNEQYDGIIGFSQGGALAGIIAGLVNDYRKGKNVKHVENISKSLKFVTVISGFYCRDTREEFRSCILEDLPSAHLPELVNVRKDLIDIPSFHVWGTEDTLVNPWRSQKLSEGFNNETRRVHIHPSSHFARAIKHWPVTELIKWLENFVQADEPEQNVIIKLNCNNAEALYEVLSKTYNDQQIYDLLLDICRYTASMWEYVIKLDTIKTNENFRNILKRAIGDELKGEYEKYSTNGSVGVPSKLAFYAPKYNSAYKESKLFYDVALYLASVMNIFDTTKDRIDEVYPKKQMILSYNQYKKVIAKLMTMVRTPTDIPERKKHIPRTNWDEMLRAPLSEFITRPRAEPVDISAPELLQPLYNFLRSEGDNKCEYVFEKGTVCTDKRLDLCKQVIGPVGINALIESLRIDSLLKNPKVKHLLLGNNICGNELGVAVAKFIKSGKSALTTWYIAGNNLTVEGVAPVCDALCDDKQVRQLWLKRNPIYAIGIPSIVNMLNHNTYLKVLDLTNTGLMDEGAIMLLNNMTNTTLEYLYLATNGLTEKTCEVVSQKLLGSNLKQLTLGCNRLKNAGAQFLADLLSHPECKLQSLEIASCGIGMEGTKYIADALKINKSLVALNIGFLKSTNDLEEVPNLIGSLGASYLADMLSVNTTLRSLDVVYTGIQQGGIQALSDVLSSKNTTLINIFLEQFGIATNELSREIIRKSIQRNKDLLSEEELKTINQIVIPEHLEEIKSVYRIQTNA
jgi:uncharacterized protein (DUF924 family)/Ran GTPase-activating protein (RanGAP) involved in mRNA processing and transport